MSYDNLQQDIIKVTLAICIGGIIGAEREYRTKSAGFRTLILVTVGSTLFTIFSIRLGGENPDRIAANIITGIGFLGAGAIFRNENRMSGITTAAIIWTAAALGMGVGSGEYLICSVATIAVLLVLLAFTRIERMIDNKNVNKGYRIVCKYEDKTLNHYEEVFRKFHLSVRRIKQSRENDMITGWWELQGPAEHHDELAGELLRDKNIISLDF